MSPKRCLRLALAAVCVATAGSLIAAGTAPGIPPKLPVEDFARTRIVGGLALSPDGKTVAYEISRGDDWVLVFQDWETGKISINPYGAAGQTPTWISGERVVYGLGASLDRSGKNGRYQKYMPAVIFARFPGDKSTQFLGSDGLEFPNVVVVDTMDDFKPDIQFSRRRVENPGRVIGWLVDGTGFVRVGVEVDKGGGQNRILARTEEKGLWVVPAGLDFAKDKIRAHWLSADGRLLYLSRITPDGTWGLYSYDLEKQKFKDYILGHTRYDILPDGAPVMAPKTREILGFYYTTDKIRAIWFDPQMAAIQDALDQSLPHRINVIFSLSDNLQRMIVLSLSARDPGTYYTFDFEKKSLKPLVPVRPWLKPAQLADCYPISYKARDGLTIHGYLTLPAGRDPKNLPLIVFPHDFPWERDTWLFNADVQFLANRGYAVLQPNYRGSSGYGPAFQEKAFRRIGREVQDDITDGARWAIDQGIADPKRVGILGYGFGGYSALMGTMQNPALYHCALSIIGRTDWTIQKKYDPEVDDTFKARIGDPEKDAAELADISPVNHVSQLQAPLFLVFADYDTFNVYRPYLRADYDLFKTFTKALTKANKPYEVLDKNMAWTGSPRKTRIELMSAIESFLDRHMPADLAGIPAATPVK